MTYTRKVPGARAAIVERYGPPEVIAVEDIPMPEAGDGQLLVEVAATAVTAADARLRAARFPRGFGVPARLVFGVRRPRRVIPGSMFSGIVIDAPAGTGFDIGDEVAGSTGIAAGAHATHLVVDAKRVVTKPPTVSHVDAAGILFGGSTVMHYLGAVAAVNDGSKTLVVGASGAVGTAAVQYAAHRGARVTAVCSAQNADLVRALGAETAIDYRVEDVTRLPDRFDLVLDAAGTLSPSSARRLLTDEGVAVLAVATLGQMLRCVGRVKAGPAPERTEHFARLLDLVAARDLQVVLDRVVDFDGLVDAHRRIDSGRKIGNIVLTPSRT